MSLTPPEMVEALESESEDSAPFEDHPHPLDPFEENGRLGWSCPADEQSVTWFGEVARTAKRNP